jgi:hypothetical protein
MPAPATLRRLSTNDLDHIRETLAAGRKPKVVFTEAAGQIAGQLGQVIELADPAVAEDWIVVRFGGDELPFSPGDLAIPQRRAAAKPADSKPPSLAAPSEERRGRRPAAVPAASPIAGPGAKGPSVSASTPPPARTPPSPSSQAAPTPPVASGSAPGRPARASRPKAPASLSVTLAYADREWTVAANQGSRTLAKPYVIKPAEALRMVSMLDMPGVHEAVETIIAAERAEAEGRAERLRAELAEIESRLSELAARD